MSLPPPFEHYPASFPYHSQHPDQRYRYRADCFACPSTTPGLNHDRILYSLPSEDLVVCSGRPPATEETGTSAVRPVYALSDAELPAIPTGRAFVQAAEGTDLEPLVTAIGYAVESVPVYAPLTAWLIAGDAQIATALSHLEELMAVRGIMSVEPQMLRPASKRSHR